MWAPTATRACAGAVTRRLAERDAIVAAVMQLAAERGTERSFCPSEAARAVSDDWRPLMPLVREVAADLGLRATQKGAQVDPLTARGPIRLRARR